MREHLQGTRIPNDPQKELDTCPLAKPLSDRLIAHVKLTGIFTLILRINVQFGQAKTNVFNKSVYRRRSNPFFDT